MATVYSVAQINQYIKNMFENDYLLRGVQIKGELSNVKYHSSGHIYFTLKDEENAIAGVMFRSAAVKGLDFTMENGLSVIVTGNVSVYERDGRYQVYARRVKREGTGNLYEAYENLKQKLYEQGLFDFEHKKEIPKYPKKVGIVTADTGAAIRDICNIAKRRNPYVQLYLYPALVQGDGAAPTIVKGIETLDRMGMDIILIGRGGGSIEDLWPFNEEVVAWAIYRARTPIISGTGHEIDTTIADYAADLRAPTPSAACELAIPDVMSLVRQTDEYKNGLYRAMWRRVERQRQRLELAATKLERVSPRNRFENQRIYMDRLEERFLKAMSDKFRDRNTRYALLLGRMNGLSPTEKLTGGYGYIENSAARPVASICDISESESVRITVHDGQIEGVVTKVLKDCG